MFNTIEEGLEELRAGRFLIVLDDEDRENEGDLIIASEFINPKKINFMMREARGLICVSMESKRLRELDIGPMVEIPDENCANFTVSVDHKDAGTGISAEARAITIRNLIDPNSKPQDFIRPGHIFPLEACNGGVFEREGHTEGVLELCKMAGLYPSGVLCEIVNEDGTMANREDIREYGKKMGIKIVTIEDIKKYKRMNGI